MNKLTLEASISVYWEAFKARIQMSSAMGDTNWTIDRISTKIIFSVSLLYVIVIGVFTEKKKISFPIFFLFLQ